MFFCRNLKNVRNFESRLPRFPSDAGGSQLDAAARNEGNKLTEELHLIPYARLWVSAKHQLVKSNSHVRNLLFRLINNRSKSRTIEVVYFKVTSNPTYHVFGDGKKFTFQLSLQLNKATVATSQNASCTFFLQNP